MSKFSENLTEIRKRSGDSQLALAEYLGVTNRTVSKWENGESEPDYSNLAAIAERYCVSVDWLLGREVKEEENPYENRTGEEIIQAYYKKVVDETRKMTMEYMKSSRSGENYHKHLAVIPENLYGGRQSGVSDNTVFANIVRGSDVNFLVALMGNEENYAWLDSDEDELAKFFTLLGKPGMMKLMLALHTPGILDSFTADYAAELNGCAAEDVAELMDLLVGKLNYVSSYDAELEEGVRRIYTYPGVGLLLAILSIAHEILRGQWYGDCMMNGNCKPIKPVSIKSKEENA